MLKFRVYIIVISINQEIMTKPVSDDTESTNITMCNWLLGKAGLHLWKEKYPLI